MSGSISACVGLSAPARGFFFGGAFAAGRGIGEVEAAIGRAVEVAGGGQAALFLIGAQRAARFAYEKILARDEGDNKTTIATEGAEATAAIADAARRLRDLIEHYDRPDTAYLSQPRPEFKAKYGNYDQLARRREWSLGEDEA